MKKVLSISMVSVLALVLTMPVLAKGGQAASPAMGTQERIQDPATNQEIPVLTPRAGQGAGQVELPEDALPTPKKAMGLANEALNRVVERTNNPEIGEQIRNMVQTHEQVQLRTKTALQEMEQRKGVAKFLLGPDYKNVGQVRSDLVEIRNNVKELEASKEDLLAADAEEIDLAIAELKTEATEIEAQLTAETSGFSLFGWVGRLFNRQR